MFYSNRPITYILIIILSILCSIPERIAAQVPSKVYVFDMKEEIGPSAWRLTRKAFAQASEVGAQTIIIRMNTFGGAVDYADSIRTRILEAPQRTIVFIDNNAASAGALISMACTEIYMRKGSSIGAASVVNAKGEVLPEKYQSYMRGLMRSTAEARGRDPKIAEAFVDPDVEIPGISEKGKVLTLTASEAVKARICRAELKSYKELLAMEKIDAQSISEQSISIMDRVISFLINPAVSAILILIIIGGIYFELQTPGIGFPLFAAIGAGLLFFAPLYLEGLAANWEIALFIVGLILLVLEIFVIPGFGVAGVLGIVFIVCGLALSLVMNDWFDFTVTASEQLTKSVILVLASMTGAIVLCVILGQSILNSPVFRKLVLEDGQRSDKGYITGKQTLNLKDKEGICTTDLRPSGKVEIDGEIYDAVALDGYIIRGKTVYVVKQESYNIFVRRKDN